jgi:hypothetical protein
MGSLCPLDDPCNKVELFLKVAGLVLSRAEERTKTIGKSRFQLKMFARSAGSATTAGSVTSAAVRGRGTPGSLL